MSTPKASGEDPSPPLVERVGMVKSSAISSSSTPRPAGPHALLCIQVTLPHRRAGGGDAPKDHTLTPETLVLCKIPPTATTKAPHPPKAYGPRQTAGTNWIWLRGSEKQPQAPKAGAAPWVTVQGLEVRCAHVLPLIGIQCPPPTVKYHFFL